ncbi:unnamed protein product [Bursaphelenchus xylophilus]|uniref:(pine wood nematode) hypothetical protein n=1 Tax=Bursaphelenchus xylophilus TaxID=6326 RepID=A0A1I7S3A8_BURXY|nr:unnamed protein product [Bursaphelenchus xylophilus]CAG9116178.1 unnamed protein product [Bursaphelenchus xylophilus]
MARDVILADTAPKFEIKEDQKEREGFKPRDYQLELLEFAQDNNCIISLGTGFGKTYIAVLLIKAYASEFQIERNGRKKRAFFVVDNVILAQQQEEHLRCHLNMNVLLLHGNISKMQHYRQDLTIFEKDWSENEVFVITAQLLNELIDAAYVRMSDIALLILDECHHVIGERHPYREIMKSYNRVEGEKPRIMGLTASVIDGEIPLRKVENFINAVEGLLCSRLKTASDVGKLSKYGTRPREIIFCYKEQPVQLENVKAILEHALEASFNCWRYDEYSDIQNATKEAFNRTSDVLKQLGPFCCYNICQMYSKQFQNMLNLESFNDERKRFLCYAKTILMKCMWQLSKMKRFPKSEVDLLTVTTARVSRLIDVLHEFYEKQQESNDGSGKDNFAAIVFVQERHTAVLLTKALKFLAKSYSKYGYMKPEHVIGRQGTVLNNDDDVKMANKRQEAIIKRFRHGEVNILVSTSVLEEGIDLKSCNCVVRFAPPNSFKSYIQSRGRARAKKAMYAVICPESECRTIKERLDRYNEVENLLMSYWPPSESEIDSTMLMVDESEEYVVESTGARVTYSSAVSHINRYCSKLPSDIFTRLVPQLNIIPVEYGNRNLYKAELLLPINAPVKHAIRTERALPSAGLAKMAVALEAVKVLHKKGELTDHLYPAGKDVIVDKTALPEDLLSEVFAEHQNLSIIGHNIKSRRLHNRKSSSKMKGVLVSPEKQAYVYIIDIKLTDPIREEDNIKRRKIINPHEEDFAFGFLCTTELPPVTPFPVAMRQGMTRVSFIRTTQKKSFSVDTLRKIYDFHQHVFDDILRVVKSAVEFNPEESNIPLLVVPIIKQRNTDGNVTDCILNVELLEKEFNKQLGKPSLEERQKMTFEKEKYEDAVVSPWYRVNEHPSYYYVARLASESNPGSKFPDEKYPNFNEYYKLKYDIAIIHQDQPLLEVDRASERMNLIFPRHVSSRARKQAYDPTQQQVLVPELVHVHPLSANYWTMIIALPTIFYRLNQFLLIEELRERILEQAFRKPIIPYDQYNWDNHPLEYDCNSIHSMTQLKQRKEIMSTSSVPATELEEYTDETSQDDESGFDIGVWDPKDAKEYQPVDLILSANGNAGSVERINEEVTVSRKNIDLDGSDAEAEEYEIITDFKLNGIAPQNLDLFTPRSDIVEASDVFGWDSVGTVHGNGCLSIISEPKTGSSINMEKLNNDLLSVLSSPDPIIVQNENQSETGPEKKKAKVSDVVEETSKEDESLPRELYEKLPAVPVSLPQNFKALNPSRPHGLCVTDSDFDDYINGQWECKAPELSQNFVFEQDFLDQKPEGVPPALMLQAVTTASASDGVNLERLETIGDSFLKMAVTIYLFNEHADHHEGRLSFSRSKEVSNANLWLKGYSKGIHSIMETAKFDPNVSWLPPCYRCEAVFHANGWLKNDENTNNEETAWDDNETDQTFKEVDGVQTIDLKKITPGPDETFPYNPMTQQCINDKSVADAVEALIGAHLISLGPRAALQFMEWLGLKVLVEPPIPASPILRFGDSEEDPNASKREVVELYKCNQFEKVEKTINYTFANKAFLVQAFTHASYFKGRATGCYQRLEFLGDAVLDYMITRYLFEHPDKFAPGVLTDLRSALVNNTIFASLAVKYEFHKLFLNYSPSLAKKIESFVKSCGTNSIFNCPNFNDELFKVTEEEIEDGQEEEVEVPKALGDIFESLAGAVYLDCNRDLDVVWRVYYNLMAALIEQCCRDPPQSPIRELYEMKDVHASFSKLERIIEKNKVRCTVEVGDKLVFHGMGRGYKIAKATAAKRALVYLKKMKAQKEKK